MQLSVSLAAHLYMERVLSLQFLQYIEESKDYICDNTSVFFHILFRQL